MNGLIAIDKPGGMTSRDVVNRVQKWFPRKTKIGHTGTLDPLATGVLVVCVGAATRLAHLVQAMPKTYRSQFRFGATSTTDDADGITTETDAAVPPTREQIAAMVPGFLGDIEQTPPAFSALKVAGRRAHDLARSGEEVTLAPRIVHVDAIRLLDYEWPMLDVEIDCGKGTYIRSIARDLGAKLGCGGMVQTLRRTRIGPFTTEQAIGMDEAPEAVRAKLLPALAACERLPKVIITATDAVRFRSGQMTDYAGETEHDPGTIVVVLDPDGGMIGLGEAVRGRRVAPDIVLPP